MCVLQIKPQLERLLRLPDDSLTKEIKLTQDLLQLFIEQQIPSDLLSFGGRDTTPAAERLQGVKRNVRAIQLVYEGEKIAAEIQGAVDPRVPYRWIDLLFFCVSSARSG